MCSPPAFWPSGGLSGANLIGSSKLSLKTPSGLIREEGPTLPVAKQCRQGGPEPLRLWNIVLDDALGPVCHESLRLGCGVRLACLAGAPGGTQPRNRAEADEWATRFAYADDLLLLAVRPFEVQHMLSTLWSAVASKGFVIKDEKLAVWSNLPSNRIRIGTDRSFRRQASRCLGA